MWFCCFVLFACFSRTETTHGKTKEEARFSNAAVSNEEDLEQIIAVEGKRKKTSVFAFMFLKN